MVQTMNTINSTYGLIMLLRIKKGVSLKLPPDDRPYKS